MNIATPPGPLILGIDVGQTAVKAVVHDAELRPVSTGRSDSPIERTAPGHAERGHDALWSSVRAAVVKAVSGADAGRIAAVAISGHGDGLHLMDAAGRGVGPAITAMDARAWVEAEEIAGDAERRDTILRVSGQASGASSPGALLLWTLRNRPDLIDRAAAMVSCKDAVRIRFTDEIVTDYSDASASFLDTTRASWSAAVLDAYGVGSLAHLLPEIRPSGAPAGVVSKTTSAETGLPPGIPVVTGMHDVQASAIGMGALRVGRLACVAGSFNTNGVTTTRPDVDPRWQSRLSVTPNIRIAMSTSPTAAPTLDWALRMLGAERPADRDRLIAAAAALPLDDEIPAVLPFFAGSPQGLDSSGTVSGLRGWHGPAHLIRGALEGIALMHHWHVSALGEVFEFDGDVVLGGGLSRSPYYARLVASALERPVRVSLEEEPGAFGAAAVAAVHLGVFADLDSAQEKARLSAAIAPDPAEEARWSHKRATFDDLIRTMTPWWKERIREQ